MAQKSNQAVKTVSFMMLITLFGKILGLVREQLLAANYATGAEAAAFLLASRIPRTFFDVIFASAISASFIPIFVEYLEKRGKKEAYILANRFITLIGGVTVAMMALGILFAEPLAWLVSPGYAADTIALAVPLLQMLFPTMLFTAVAFSFVGILQSLDEFNVPAALSVVSNGILILYYIFFNEKFGIYGLTNCLFDWLGHAGRYADSFPASKRVSLSSGFPFSGRRAEKNTSFDAARHGQHMDTAHQFSHQYAVCLAACPRGAGWYNTGIRQ